jgi:CDP-4-dehydro-6-deoxyglucose reductase
MVCVRSVLGVDVGYRVRLQPSGNEFEVPDGKDILNSALAARLSVPYSCKTGVCRTCRARVLEGTLDHGMVHPHYLSDEEKAAGFAHLCQAKPTSDMVLEIEELTGLAGIEVRKFPGRVTKIERLADDVIQLDLRLPPNDNVRYLAGQYLAIQTPDGDSRNYSIAVPPKAEAVGFMELHIRYVPDGKFTEHVFNSVKARDLLKLEGPLGTFYIREESPKPMIMVASGTGFAPMKAMLEYAFSMDMLKKRPIQFYWGCRTKKDLYMLDLVEAWADTHPELTFHPVLSDPTAECEWRGRTGFVHEAVVSDNPDMSAVQVYAAGNPAMVDAARLHFIRDCALPAQEFFADSFLTERERNTAATS